MESFWPRFLLDSIKILVLETTNIAQLSVKNRSLAKDFLVSV